MTVSAGSLVAAPTSGLPLGALLAYHSARDPKRIALIFDDNATTFAELDARANRRARMLAAEGVAQGDFVTLALPNGPAFYEHTFALWKLGAIPNVISSKLPPREIEAIVALVDPRVTIGLDPAVLPGRAALPAGVPLNETVSAGPLPEAVSPNWKAMTSGGSTGRPKVILDSAPGRWDPAATLLGQRPGDVLLNPGPLYHNGPFLGMHSGLFTGSTVVEMGKFDAERVLTLIDRHRVNWVNLVPTMMQRIWRLDAAMRDRFDLASLRVVFHMAAPCPAWLKLNWIEWIGAERLFELYAGTERLGATLISGTEWLTHKGSVGRPQPGAAIRIMDEAGKACEPGEIGEIWFRPDAGLGSTYRYLGAEARQMGDWESLGDLGWIDGDGFLYLADRRTDLIISGGANIYPAEVEAALEAHPGVLSAIVIGLPDDEWGQRVHAIVQRVSGAHVDAADLIVFAADRIARYKLPKSIEFTAEPLRDDAGKARRSRLLTDRV